MSTASEKIFASVVDEYVPDGMRMFIFELRVLGFWPTPTDSRLYTWTTMALFVLFGFLFPLTMVVNVFFVNSVTEVMDHMFYSVSLYSSTYKLSVTYSNRENIRELFRTHAALSYGVGYNDVHDKRTARMNIIIHTVFMCLYIACCIGFLLQTAFSPPEESVFASTLLYPSDFMHRRAMYLSLLLFQCTGNVISTVWAALNDSFYIALMNMACSHVTDLKYRLNILGARYAANVDRNAIYYKDLMDCCKRYEECSRFGIRDGAVSG